MLEIRAEHEERKAKEAEPEPEQTHKKSKPENTVVITQGW